MSYEHISAKIMSSFDYPSSSWNAITQDLKDMCKIKQVPNISRHDKGTTLTIQEIDVIDMAHQEHLTTAVAELLRQGVQVKFVFGEKRVKDSMQKYGAYAKHTITARKKIMRF